MRFEDAVEVAAALFEWEVERAANGAEETGFLAAYPSRLRRRSYA